MSRDEQLFEEPNDMGQELQSKEEGRSPNDFSCS